MSENNGRQAEPHARRDESLREVSDTDLQDKDDSKVGDKLIEGKTPTGAAEAKAAGEEAKQSLP
jgi:hypothetical protein